MSTTEKRPPDEVCTGTSGWGAVQILEPRDVPLGGPRAMTVRRTLPNRHRAFVGAWCFADHYGPDDVSVTGGMDVPPHPHTGLQTVSWLFEGEIEHRDSAGNHAMVRPGEVDLMTAGAGICHSEVSTPETTTLHGLQLWTALPDSHRHTARRFEPRPVEARTLAEGVRARVFVGSFAGVTSPVWTATPLVGVELRLTAGTTWTVPVDPTHEHGVIVDHGDVEFCGTAVPRHALGVVDAGRTQLEITARTDTLLVLLGGEPFEEEIVMWWNFVGRSHEEIETFRAEWQAGAERFGEVEGYTGETDRLPVPPLPGVSLKPRGRLGLRRR